MLIIVMGVTASGKTTLGRALAEALKIPFADADDFHPAVNREKMARGEPLDDADRAPWLVILAKELRRSAQTGGVVLACSALKESYRKQLQAAPEKIVLVYVRCTQELAVKRALARTDHPYIATQAQRIIEGQFRDLEEPRDAIVVDTGLSTKKQVQEVLHHLREQDLLY